MHNMKHFQNVTVLQGTGKIFPLSCCRNGGISYWTLKTLTDFFLQSKEGSVSLYVSKKIDILADNINVYVCIFQNAVVIWCSCTMNHILKSYIRFGLWLKSGFFSRESLNLVKSEMYYYLRYNCNNYWKAENPKIRSLVIWVQCIVFING